MRGFTLILGLVAAGVSILPQAELRADPALVIFDSDMSTDVDDVGALALLNKLTNLGEAKMLACVTNDGIPQKAIAAAMKAVNTYYGNPGVPIGTCRAKKFAHFTSAYDVQIRDEFASAAPPDDLWPTALEVYRRALAAAPDGSVTIISVGFLVNLQELLHSRADAASPLPGRALVRRKVKQIVVMGGQYPKSDRKNGEWNFAGNGAGPLTRDVVENWPTAILFTGYEIGLGITTGTTLRAGPAGNPVRRAYELATQFHGRPSWDLTAVLAAVRDPRLYWDVMPDGYNRVASDGTNQWFPMPHRGHSYLIPKMPRAKIAARLDRLLTLPPGPAR